MTKNLSYLGKKYITKDGYKIVVVDYINYHNAIVEFPNGYRRTAHMNAVKHGRVPTPYHPTVYGVGFLGEGDYPKSIDGKHSPAYIKWHSMMARCYSKTTKKTHPTYKDCTVCEEWHNFQNFAKWYEENYYEIDNETMCLDKDILIKGNKVYSPQTCVFVPNDINVLFIKKHNHRGEYPMGVSYHKNDKKYCSRCSNPLLKETVTIGRFETPDLAFSHYKEYKESLIKEVANIYKEKIPHNLYVAMYRYEVDIED